MVIGSFLVNLALAGEAEDVHARLVALHDSRIAKDAPLMTLEQVQRSFTGETVTATARVADVPAVKGYGAYLYDLPISQIWMAITDTPHHPSRLAVDRSETVSGVPRQNGRVTFQLLELPLIADRWWIVQTQTNEGLYQRSDHEIWETVWFDRTSDPEMVAAVAPELKAMGIPVSFARGSWFLIDLGERTWAQYYVWTDPGGNLPIAATNQFAEQQVARAIHGLDKVARTHILGCAASYFAPDGSRMTLAAATP